MESGYKAIFPYCAATPRKYFTCMVMMLLCMLLSISALAVPKDTVSPQGRIVEPAPFFLITNNSISLRAEASDTGSGIKEVRFFALYRHFIDSTLWAPTPPDSLPYEFLGAVPKPPYQLTWDCSKIPDQDVWRMRFKCDIEDKAGNISHAAGGEIRYVVLDRHPDTSSQTAYCVYVRTPPAIDGDLSDWRKNDSIIFVNGNNKIQAWFSYDNEQLYGAICVTDANLRTPPENARNPDFQYYDCVQIYLDAARDRSPFRHEDDLQVDVGLGDTVFMNVVDFEKGVHITGHVPVRHAVRPLGTINDNSDRDSGYVVELSIPFAAIGIHPGRMKAVGFDLFNVDNDFTETVRMSKGWSGTERYNNNNPSEWGTLVFRPKPINRGWVVAAACIAILFAGIFVSIKKRKQRIEERPLSRSEQIAAIVKQYLEANFHRNDLSLEISAQELRMSAGHISQMLKKETGEAYSDYLRRLRVEKSKEMLKSLKTENITEIAFKSGFNSLEYFIASFKKFNNGKTPSQFRAENQ